MTAPTSKQRTTTHQRSEVGEGFQIPTIGSRAERADPREGKADRKFRHPPDGSNTVARVFSAPETVRDLSERGPEPEQGRFPGTSFAECKAPRRARRTRVTAPPPEPDALMAVFTRRLAGAYRPKTGQQYLWGVDDVLKLATERQGRLVSLNELFADESLLGAILVSAARAGGGPEVSGWTVSARRNAVSAAANLLAPELRARGISEPERAVNSALRLRAERIGKRYRLPKPLLRKDGRRPSPSAAEVAALVQVAERDPGWAGARHAGLIETMFVTGARVNAVRELDGTAIYREPNGSGRMLVHAKHWKDSGEFLLPEAVMARLDAYAAGFNQWAAARGLSTRVGVGVAGPFWRSRRGAQMSYREINRRLTEVCALAGTVRYTPHAFRHAFATLATETVPRFTVARAGGWGNLSRVMDETYTHRDIDTAREKVVAALGPNRRSDDSEMLPVVHEPASVG